MAPLTSSEIAAVVAAVLACVVLAALGLTLLRRIRRRQAQLRGELSGRPELVSDRAFNRLAMARREIEVLGRQGSDVARPRELIAQSQAAFDGRDFVRSYELAQTAHEALVAARKRPAAPAGRPLSDAAPLPATAPPAPSTGLTAHRAESQFQLRLLESAIGSAVPSDARTKEATGLLAEGRAAYDRADYASAFRLALRGRRALGAPVEGLPPIATRPTSATGPADPAQLAEAAATAERCPQCGYPLRTDDAFCRGCGAARSGARCPKCAAPRAATDTFCGKCGASFG